jgi:hypothetical protein
VYSDYQFTKPPKALLKARLNNIAIVPASMLPLTKIIREVFDNLPKGAVFLCHAEENTRQRKLLERVEETFKQQGHTVMNLSMEQVYKIPQTFSFYHSVKGEDHG